MIEQRCVRTKILLKKCLCTMFEKMYDRKKSYSKFRKFWPPTLKLPETLFKKKISGKFPKFQNTYKKAMKNFAEGNSNIHPSY